MEVALNLIFYKNAWFAFLLIFARTLGALVIFPMFSKTYITGFLRTTLAVIFAVIYYPGLKSSLIPAGGLYALLLFSNFCYGALIGYLLSVPIWIIESCGRIIDQQRGEQIGAIVNQLTGAPSSSIGKLLSQAFVAYFAINNGIVFFLDMLGNSFKLCATTNLVPIISKSYLNEYIRIFASYLYWVAVLTLPVIVLLLLIDLILSLISSFIPQLNVTVISMPIKSIAALFVLVLYIGVLFHEVMLQIISQVRGLFGS